MSCSVFGSRPSDSKVAEYSSLENFNDDKSVFTNNRQKLMDEERSKSFSFSLLKDWFRGGVDRFPVRNLPEIKPDLNDFLKPSESFKSIWFGHSSFLLNVDQHIILIDPVFSNSASPFDFMVKRFQKPVLKLEELPTINFIVISHDHYDHLDMETIKFFARTETIFITPLGVGSHLEGWGVRKENIIEKNWWETTEFGDLDFISTPAQHFSGRGVFDTNKTLWSSWIIKSSNHNIYYSGDSGYDKHFKEIGDKYGPFDIAFIESGQYNQSWKLVHLLPEEGIQAYKDLKAKRYFPVHWGMFELSLHPWYEPVDFLLNHAKKENINLVIPKLGEIFESNSNYHLESWWQLDKLKEEKK